MQQIADWLKELGIAEYSERFAEKHIDIGVVRELTDQDLKDLGVVSIGHRRPPPTSLSKSQDYAERRQLAGHSGASVGGRVITFSEPSAILCQWRRRRSRWGGADEVEVAVEKRPRED
jgi:hypothetical protein